jgi:hypothetical protein
MQETVLVHNRIYSLLETVGRTNPAIDGNTTPSPDYSKLKLGDMCGKARAFRSRLAGCGGRIAPERTGPEGKQRTQAVLRR